MRRSLSSHYALCFCCFALLGIQVQETLSQELLIVCPVQRTIDYVRGNSDGTFTPFTQQETSPATYFWDEVQATGNSSCASQPISFQEASSGNDCLPSSALDNLDGLSVCNQQGNLSIAAYSFALNLAVDPGPEVRICQNTYGRPSILADLADSTKAEIQIATTGCLAVTGVSLPILQEFAATGSTFSTDYIQAAGFNFTSPNPSNSSMVPEDIMRCNLNGSYEEGLTTQFYLNSDSSYTVNSPLSLSFGASNATRCTSPTHYTAGLPWDVQPSLDEEYDAEFGATFSGDLAIQNSSNWSGLGGWELLCLQFNDAAQMDIDGVTRISATRAINLGLGYREICKAVQLLEGWHSILLRYRSAKPDPAFSILKLFSVDAIGIEGGAIKWETDATLCTPAQGLVTGSNCTRPPSACSFRSSYGCGSGLISVGSPLPTLDYPFVIPLSTSVQYSLPANFSGFGSVVFTPTQPEEDTAQPPSNETEVPIEAPQISADVPSFENPLIPATAPGISTAPGLEVPSPQTRQMSSQAPSPEPGMKSPISGPSQSLPPSPIMDIIPAPAPSVSVPGPTFAPAPGSGLILSPEASFASAPSLIPTLAAPSPGSEPSKPPVLLSPSPQSPPPAPISLPNLSGCTVIASSCWLAEAGSQSSNFTIPVTCKSDPGQYITQIIYPAGFASGWLSLTSASAEQIKLVANTSQLQEGRYPAMLELMQSGVSQTMAIPIKVVLVMVGKPRTSFLQTGMSDSTHAYASATTQLSLQQMGLSVSTTVRLVSAEEAKIYYYNSDIVDPASELQYTIQDSIQVPVSYEVFDYSLLVDTTHIITFSDQNENLQCGTLNSEAAATITSSPQCFLLAEDLPKQANGIPITSSSQAQIALACTAPVEFCASCLAISGPSNDTVISFGRPGSTASQAVNRLLLQWPESYNGLVTIDVQGQRAQQGCSLDIQSNCQGRTGQIPSIKPLQIQVQNNLPDTLTKPSFSYQCRSDYCRFDA